MKRIFHIRILVPAVLVGLAVTFFGLLPLQPDRPNVLLIISDDLNTNIGPYMDTDKHTPSLDRLASEGIRFSRAYSQYPLCGPSRASLMSGLYPETNGVMGNSNRLGSYRAHTPALANHPSMAGFFKEQGYFTARVSKIYHMGVPGGIERGEPGGDDPDSWDYAYNVFGPETQSPGELELLSPGNLHYGSNFARMIIEDGKENTQTDYLAASQAIAILESRAGAVAPNAKNLTKHKPEAPFFLAVGLVRPHVPLIAPENCFDHYPESEMLLPEVVVGDDVPSGALQRQNDKSWKMDEEQKRKTIGAYMASVRFMDQQVGRLLDALDRLELRENTIVVFISDHGYNLGEHDCWSKVSLWEGSVRVPMIISHPAYTQNGGTVNPTVTELIDLYPTLTSLAGLTDKRPDILQGKDLSGFVTGDKETINDAIAYTISYGGEAASIRTDRWRYTRWGEDIEEGNEELYDHSTDPEEHINLAYNKKSKKVLEEMRSKWEKARQEAK